MHIPAYLEFLATAWQRWVERDEVGPAAMGLAWPPRGFSGDRLDDLIGQIGFHGFSADTSIVAGTWAAALAAASIAMTAADGAIDRGATTYGLCRPPGHHASADQFGGCCYLNNAAIAAQRLLDRGAARVGILDVDYHHGNGTQSVFWNRSDVMVVSIHAEGIVEGPGDGWNLNRASSPGIFAANRPARRLRTTPRSGSGSDNSSDNGRVP